MRKSLAAAAVAVVIGVAGAACSSPADDTAGGVESPRATPSDSQPGSPRASVSPGPKPARSPSDRASAGRHGAVEIEIEGSSVEPNGRRVRVDAGVPVRLEIESDRAGELHVHSTPEQTIGFPRGKSVREITVDTPGVVDVEEHESDKVLLQLEVR